MLFSSPTDSTNNLLKCEAHFLGSGGSSEAGPWTGPPGGLLGGGGEIKECHLGAPTGPRSQPQVRPEPSLGLPEREGRRLQTEARFPWLPNLEAPSGSTAPESLKQFKYIIISSDVRFPLQLVEFYKLT